MRKSLSIKRLASCMLIFLGSIASFTAYGSLLKQSDGEEIWLHPKPTNPQGTPHMPAYVPFYAEFGNGNVLLGSYSNLGTVDVSLTSTAGDDYSTVFDTSNGTIIIPISGLTGDYTLLITTLSGAEFIGEFSI